MARPRTIDRNLLLDAAEAVVAREGATALSFAAVAKAAGLSKASVQSVFGTRAALIDMLIERWVAEETARFAAALGGSDTPAAHLAAHLDGTLEDMLGQTGQRVTTLLAMLAGEADQSRSLREWYAARLGSLAAATEEERRRRICYLAAEGAIFLRCLVGLNLDEAIWREIFADLKDMATP